MGFVMTRLAPVRDALALWSVVGGIVMLVVATARPASEPDRPSSAEALHRCHSDCRFYEHSAAGRAEYEASVRELVALGQMEAPGPGE